ncbi:hypothetical protein ACTQ54_08305 [Fundicoccus sp. Sow4_H7]|uniref:hypothetical protein n=1 Tax=Fundicoccus sp. Sow4_H7 TaxID=3438784 RepID=UPI003F9395B5
MNVFMLIGLFYLLRYVKKIQADPEKSLMYAVVGDFTKSNADDQNINANTDLSWRTILTLALFIG